MPWVDAYMPNIREIQCRFGVAKENQNALLSLMWGIGLFLPEYVSICASP